MRAHIVAVALCVAVSIASLAQGESAPGRAAPASYSTSTTDIGTLLDDPAARAVLDKHLPKFSADPQVSMTRGMTLKAIQPYAANITDAVLAAIDADLSALSRKR